MLKKEELAYIAGFLDGDGCIMLQLVFRHDYVLGYQIRASIVFYQKTQYRDFLVWLKSKFEFGYVRDRNDGMSEYTIVGSEPVKSVLTMLLPFIRLKERQAKLTLEVISKMPGSGRKMDVDNLYKLSLLVDKFLELNYSKKRTNTSLKVREFLISHNLLNPVETDSKEETSN